jgi:hypothetical protein
MEATTLKKTYVLSAPQPRRRILYLFFQNIALRLGDTLSSIQLHIQPRICCLKYLRLIVYTIRSVVWCTQDGASR